MPMKTLRRIVIAIVAVLMTLTGCGTDFSRTGKAEYCGADEWAIWSVLNLGGGTWEMPKCEVGPVREARVRRENLTQQAESGDGATALSRRAVVS